MWLAWQAWWGEKTVRLRNCQIVSEGERDSGTGIPLTTQCLLDDLWDLIPNHGWWTTDWKLQKNIQSNPGKADPYADIDFEEINEQTNLANDEIKCLKVKSTNYVSVFWLLTFPGLLRPVWHQEAGVPLWRRPWWHHEGDGIQASKILEGTPQLSSFAKWEENFKQISGLLRRSWLNFCTRLTRMAPERLNSVRTI